MAGIELIPTQITEPMVCGPISDFKELTTIQNAFQLGWIGYAAGILTALLFYVGAVYVAPMVVNYGFDHGWWA